MEQTPPNQPPISPPESPQPPPPTNPSINEPEQLRPKEQKLKHSIVAALAIILIIGLVGGGLIGYALSYNTFNGKINALQSQLQNLPPSNATYVSYPSTTYVLGNNVTLASLYEQVKSSVVVIQGLIPQYSIFFNQLVGYGTQQGSGFVTLINNQPVIVTNNHVMQGAINVTVTFANGDSYPAKEVGSDPLADLAVITINASPNDLQPLNITTSSTLQVGDPVVAVGSPYGLSGTLTTGVVSALGRTITETSESSQSSGINIPDVIQTSTAINPGNSGGPLIDYHGNVVGITTAAVSSSQGLGFAIPSETILREINTLYTTGTYDKHPTINVAVGTDMDYSIAQAMGINVTYGFLVESISTQNGLKGGSTQVSAGAEQVVIGGDVIVGINGTTIVNTDSLLSYLEQHTLPGQVVDFNVIRDGQAQNVPVTIGKLSAT
ncbi:MAG TPA: trypsin-like peptidase domain-containing protein [Candidatus Nanoarchaeia archaeon]|nr:trypsin-like peptidase domain-containing protein [Candidatus Nanoarchaeia archaeon]